MGQEHVTDPLSVALDTGRISHAYLFSGPRGCGKTSSARILARSLNCAEGPTSRPCGVCSSCVALAPGGAGNLDVIELDAASHGGVDDTRELRDRAFYAPAESRYRVFIVDEAHMVTTAGFNALLKIVEEPPAHLIFIFATTEPDKVLPTIRSRTHHYPFRLLPPATMRGLLGRICEQEHVPVEEAVYPLVIRAGGGSPRDSLSVLDQLLAGAGPEGVTYPRAVSLLGVTDVALIDDAIAALATSDGAALFGTIDRVMEAGHDPRRFSVDLLERLRDLILLRAVPDAAERGLVAAPGDMLERMHVQADSIGPAALTRYAELLHAGLGEMRGATAPRLLLEVICARMLLPAATETDAAALQRLERLERQFAAGAIPSAPAGESGATTAAPADAPPRSAPADPNRRRGAEALAALRESRSAKGDPESLVAQPPAPGHVREQAAPEPPLPATQAASEQPSTPPDRPAPPPTRSATEPAQHTSTQGRPADGQPQPMAEQDQSADDRVRQAAGHREPSGEQPQPAASHPRSSADPYQPPTGGSDPAGAQPQPSDGRSRSSDQSAAPVDSPQAPPAGDPRAVDSSSTIAERTVEPEAPAGAGSEDLRGGSPADVGSSAPPTVAAASAPGEARAAASTADPGSAQGDRGEAVGRPDVRAHRQGGEPEGYPDATNQADQRFDGRLDADAETAAVADVGRADDGFRYDAPQHPTTPQADASTVGSNAGTGEPGREAAAGSQAPARADAEAETAGAAPAATGDPLAEVEAAWPDIKAEVRKIAVAVHAMLTAAAPARVDGQTAVFVHPHDALVRRLSEPRSVDALRTALRTVLGREFDVRFETGAGQTAPRGGAGARGRGGRESGGGGARRSGDSGAEEPGPAGGAAEPAAPRSFSRPSSASSSPAADPQSPPAEPVGEMAAPARSTTARTSTPPRFSRPSQAKAAAVADDDIPPPDYPDLPDDPGPEEYGGAAIPPPTPEEEQEMLAESARPVAPGDRQDPDEVALQLLASELGAVRLE